MAGNRRVFYWDSCCFLAWLQEEDEPPGSLAQLREIVVQVDRGEIILIVSSLFRTEVLQSSLTPKAKRDLEEILKGKKVQEVALDPRVAALAGEIRDYYQQRKTENKGQTLATPDSIHLATAMSQAHS